MVVPIILEKPTLKSHFLIVIYLDHSHEFSISYSSSYGDSYFITLQNSIIGFLVYYYGTSAVSAVFYLTAALSTTALLCYGMVPLNILWYLQAMNIPMVFAGKVGVVCIL